MSRKCFFLLWFSFFFLLFFFSPFLHFFSGFLSFFFLSPFLPFSSLFFSSFFLSFLFLSFSFASAFSLILFFFLFILSFYLFISIVFLQQLSTIHRSSFSSSFAFHSDFFLFFPIHFSSFLPIWRTTLCYWKFYDSLSLLNHFLIFNIFFWHVVHWIFSLPFVSVHFVFSYFSKWSHTVFIQSILKTILDYNLSPSIYLFLCYFRPYMYSHTLYLYGFSYPHFNIFSNL